MHHLGAIKKDTNKARNVVKLSFSSDGCVFQSWKKKAFTPLVGQILNWPPKIRTLFGAMLVFAIFPPKVTKLQFDITSLTIITYVFP